MSNTEALQMNLSPEWKLLLACARTNMPGEDFQRVRDELVDTDLDWGHFTKISCAHGIAPLIYHSLRRSGAISLLPPAPAETLRSSYYGNAARNSLLYDELRRVLKALREENLEVIVLKGAALAEIVYGQWALRPMSDIDLLVRKEKLAEVEAKLVHMGYVLEEHGKTKEYYQEHHYHVVFAKSAATAIEVHWHIQRPIAPFRIDIDDLWKRAQPAALAGVEALVLSPEDLLLHLCQHAWKHNLSGGIRPLCDIAETTNYYRKKIDWKKVATLSSDWQMAPCLYLGLWLAREMLGARIPQSFIKRLRPAGFNTELLDWARQRLLAHGENSPVFPDLLQLFWKGRRLKERWAILQRILSRKTVAGYAANTSASKKAYLYYPLRVKHLLTRYGPTAYALLTGDQKTRAAAGREEDQRRLSEWLSSDYQ